MVRIRLSGIFYGLFFLILAGVVLQCRQPEYTGRRTAAPVTVDGADGEWEVPFLQDGSLKLEMAAQYDSIYLYLCLRTRDAALQQAVLQRGLTTWFDGTGGDQRNFGLRFPVRMEAPPDPEMAEPAPLPEKAEAPANPELELLSRFQPAPVRMASGGTGGIEAAYAVRGDLMIYELKVPLHSNGSGRFTVGADTTGAIGIGFSVPSAVPAAGSAPGQREGFPGGMAERGAPPGDRSGPPPGGRPGMRGDPGGRPGPGRTTVKEDDVRWLTVRLAG